MRRREFIAGLVGAATWPFVVRAQSDRMRRIGMLMAYAAGDPEAQLFVRTFVQGLSEFGWTDGKNLQIDLRWAAGDVEQIRAHAKQLVAANPELVQRFVDASIEGWHDFLYGDPAPANVLIKKDNPEQTDALLAFGREKMK